MGGTMNEALTDDDLEDMREQLGDLATPMSEVWRIADALIAEIRRLRDQVSS